MELEKINKKIIICEILKNLLFIISTTIVTFLLSNTGTGKQRLFSIALSFIIACFATFKLKILPKIFKERNTQYSLLSIFFALSTSFFIARECYSFNTIIEPARTIFVTILKHHSLIMYTLIILSLYALYSFYYYFISRLLPKVISFFKSFEKCEKYYLIIATSILGICIIVIYSLTNVFYAATINGEVQTFDVIYSSDTGAHAVLNDYLNVNSVENDLRQPLFAVFSFPFAIVAYMIGNLFNTFGNGYFILIAIIQVFLMNICCIMLGRMLNLKHIEKTLFLIFYTVTYPFILFAFNLEQYVFGVFWLFCFIYSYVQNEKGNKFYFVASIGSLLTNCFFFPFLTTGKKIKQWLTDFITTGLAFISGIIVFGQFPIILNIFTGAGHLSNYISGKIEFNTFCQYSNFVKNCFIAPMQTITEERLGHISFQLAPATSLSIVGIILFILVIAGFILNRKDKFVKICMAWVTFSIILLIILGYGTRENGLILYSLYFSWAFVSLIFLLFKKLLQNRPKLFTVLFAILIVGLLIVNLYGLLDLVQFGLQNFDNIV